MKKHNAIEQGGPCQTPTVQISNPSCQREFASQPIFRHTPILSIPENYSHALQPVNALPSKELIYSKMSKKIDIRQWEFMV
ncbi:MAG: hypothetical protein K0S39_1975 [Paenibacillus sp.]|jgi:hypothetical protein|nr:hypothetical protein [Paenibacillus sp.]